MVVNADAYGETDQDDHRGGREAGEAAHLRPVDGDHVVRGAKT